MGGRFLFRNTNMSTLPGLRLALFFVTIFPEVEISISLRRHRRSKDVQQLSRYSGQSGKSLCICFFLPFQDIGVRIKRRHFQEVIQLITACINRFFLWESVQEKVHGAIFLRTLTPLSWWPIGFCVHFVESVPSLSPSISRDSIRLMSSSCAISLCSVLRNCKWAYQGSTAEQTTGKLFVLSSQEGAKRHSNSPATVRLNLWQMQDYPLYQLNGWRRVHWSQDKQWRKMHSVPSWRQWWPSAEVWKQWPSGTLTPIDLPWDQGACALLW